MLRKQIFLLGNKKMFLPQVKNIFASRTQILLPKHMFPSLATMKAMLTSFQDCSLSQFIIVRMRDLLNVSSFSHRGSKTFCLLPANLATPKT